MTAALPTPLDTAPPTSAPRTQGRLRTIGYWAFTLIIALEMTAGSLWDLLRIEFVRGVFARLGYPVYLLLILGAWKLPCAAALLAPGFPRLKEWAYAGTVFLYTGAAASHFLAGEGPATYVGPVVFGAFTMASWALRPDDRRVGAPAQSASARRTEWIAALGLLAGFLVFAALTLPKGPPPP